MAFQNFEWDNVRAEDIYVLITSFTSPGSVKKVEVYPSDFGLERMEKDATLGPQGLWIDHEGGESEKESDEEGGGSEVGLDRERSDGWLERSKFNTRPPYVMSLTTFHSSLRPSQDDVSIDMLPSTTHPNQVESDFDPEKLRRYEASKLKYYFAVATFASHDAANVAYKELDGIELEHSSCAIDVRAIPPEAVSSVSENRALRDSCDAVPATYEAPEFISKALQQSSVECSWETGDDERSRKLTKWGVR